MAGYLDGKVVIITGGGQGIGRATVDVCAREGARIMVCDINEEPARKAAEAVAAAGGEAISIACDVSKEDQVERMVAATVEKWGRLDGAFNNAGIGAGGFSLVDDTLELWQQVLDVDLLGAMLCMKHEIRAMRKVGGGSIVNNASNAGKAGVPKLASYGAAKAGVINLTMSAAVEFGPENIRVNAVCPGMIMSETMKALRAQNDASATGVGELQIALERPGEPSEIGEATAWLLSPLASYVTGQALSVDGGMQAFQ